MTEFPPGLEVRDASRAAWPTPEGDDAAPETLIVEMGEENEVFWAHGRAYVHAPIEAVARALQNPDVTVSRRSVDEWTTEVGVEADYPVSYRSHCIVHALITVSYDITWRQAPRLDNGEMTSYVANYQKTDGTQYITVMRGWIRAEPVTSDLTRIEFVSELQAMRTSPEDAASYVRDLYASVVAAAHDQPLPVWEDG